MRSCGGCTACCKVLKIEEMNKPAEMRAKGFAVMVACEDQVEKL